MLKIVYFFIKHDTMGGGGQNATILIALYCKHVTIIAVPVGFSTICFL